MKHQFNSSTPTDPLAELQCISVEEAARLLNKSSSHIYDLIHDVGSSFPAVRLREGSFTVHLEGLRDWILNGGIADISSENPTPKAPQRAKHRSRGAVRRSASRSRDNGLDWMRSEASPSS